MFLRDAAQADLVLDVGGERWRVPLFGLGDFVDWGAEVDADRLARATAGMDDEKRFQFVAFHDVPASGLDELIRLLRTPAGAHRVCGRCLAAAVVTRRGGRDLDAPEPVGAERAKAVTTANLGMLPALTKRLAACDDPSKLREQAEPAGGGDGAGPLTSGGTGGSPNSPATGQGTSPSSPPSTPDGTPAG